MLRGGARNRGVTKYKDFLDAVSEMKVHDLLIWSTADTPPRNISVYLNTCEGVFLVRNYNGKTFIIRAA